MLQTLAGDVLDDAQRVALDREYPLLFRHALRNDWRREPADRLAIVERRRTGPVGRVDRGDLVPDRPPVIGIDPARRLPFTARPGAIARAHRAARPGDPPR